MKSFLTAAKYLALTIFIVVVSALIAAIWFSRIPPDSQIQKQFIDNKGILEELRIKLAQEPPNIVGITENKVMAGSTSRWISPEEAGFSKDRFDQYQVLMKKARVNQFWNDGGKINFNIGSWGIAGSGWRLSFAYIKNTPSPLIGSIDSPTPPAGDPSVLYRPLGDNWYIRLLFE